MDITPSVKIKALLKDNVDFFTAKNMEQKAETPAGKRSAEIHSGLKARVSSAQGRGKWSCFAKYQQRYLT